MTYDLIPHIDGRQLLALKCADVCFSGWVKDYRFYIMKLFIDICEKNNLRILNTYQSPIDNKELFEIKLATTFVTNPDGTKQWTDDIFTVEVEEIETMSINPVLSVIS